MLSPRKSSPSKSSGSSTVSGTESQRAAEPQPLAPAAGVGQQGGGRRREPRPTVSAATSWLDAGGFRFHGQAESGAIPLRESDSSFTRVNELAGEDSGLLTC